MSSSKLSALCDGLIEAGWLSAVIVAPLFVNIYASRGSEADRMSLLRLLASVMAAAWLVKWIEQRALPRVRSEVSIRSPLTLPTLLLAVVYLLATLTALSPRLSFFGAYPNPEATYGALAYLVVFAMLLHGLRTQRQLERLGLTIVLTSLPVALYALIQWFNLDPLARTSDMGARVTSTLGDPSSVGAYLLMALLLTLAKGADMARASARGPLLMRLANLAGALAGALIGALQVSAIILSGGREPFLGLLVGVMFFALMLTMLWRRRALTYGLIGLGILGVGLLVAMNLTNQTREVSETSQVWEGASKLVFPHAPLQFPDGEDLLNGVRPLIGYGPDSLYLTFSQVHPPALARLTLPDAPIVRSHNETWDVLATTGLIGLLVYQSLFGCIFLYGLSWAGLVSSRLERAFFIELWGGLAFCGGLATILLGQTQYLGVAVPAGNVAAIFLYLLLAAPTLRRRGAPRLANPGDAALLAGLLAGMLAYYVVIQFSPAIAATRVLFWSFAGLFVAIGSRRLEIEDAPAQSRVQTKRAWSLAALGLGEVASYAWIVALILATLLTVFVRSAKEVADPAQILWRALTFSDARSMTSYAILGLIGMTWLLAVIVVLLEMIRTGTLKTPGAVGAGLARLAFLPIGAAFLFGLGLAIQLGSVTKLGTGLPRLEDVIARAERIAALPGYYVAALLLLVALTALAVFAARARAAVAWAHGWRALALVPLAALTCVWVSVSVLEPMRAEVFHTLGQEYAAQRRWNAASALYQRAIHLAPTEDFYYMALGRALWSAANSTTSDSAPQFDEWTRVEDVLNLSAARLAQLNRVDSLYAAQAMLVQAYALAPLLPARNLDLARLYLPELPINTEVKAKLVDLSNQYYAQTLRVGPNDAAVWNEWARLDLKYRNDPDAALRKLEASLRRDSGRAQTYLYLGDAYAAKRDVENAVEAYEKALALQPDLAEAYFALGDLYEERQDWAQAAGAYQQVLAQVPSATKAFSRLAFVFHKQGRIPEAIQVYYRYIEVAPDDPNLWEVYKNLALLYQQLGDLPTALRVVESAANLAPRDLQGQLKDAAAQLRAQMSKP